MALESQQPGSFALGLQFEGWIEADKMDDAFAFLIRELEPQLEAWLGLQGLTGVRFAHESTRMRNRAGT
jgi:hypothetical protein